VAEEKREEHDTVGWRFKFCGAVYRCTRYERAQGFWMRLIEKSVPLSFEDGHELGYETCVSERAIGRTYHKVWSWDKGEKPEPHAANCECYICRP
jgi:hypothetical protein